MTINAFRIWLNQLIIEKKGALPDFNDWKLIKQQLDNVTNTNIVENSQCSLFPADCEYDPYDFQFTIDYINKLCDNLQLYDEYTKIEDQ